MSTPAVPTLTTEFVADADLRSYQRTHRGSIVSSAPVPGGYMVTTRRAPFTPEEIAEFN